MTVSSGHWYPILSSRELKKNPISRTRFGQRVVIWRDATGQAVVLDDRCPHRGAALSQGRVRDGVIECPFHGFRYDAAGRCVLVPAEGDDWQIPAHLRVTAYSVREDAGYVWLWRGPKVAAAALPPLPRQPILDGLIFGETHYIWNAHYTRCIENVIDYSHLPFVHRKNLGAFIKNPATQVLVKPFTGGFNFYLADRDDFERQFVEFVYPTLWANRIGKRFVMAATFVPVDDAHTDVYVRWYHKLPGLVRPLVDLYGQFSQYIVFNDDLPIVASQQPSNVDDANIDKLVPSDAALVAFRKLRRAHQDEIQSHIDDPAVIRSVS
jgi:phenylpropionate dioxygenase-like ring-hydroxylating dioxygenase large terminal subunit